MKELLGKDYIMSLKPLPTPLAASVLDEEEIRSDIRSDLTRTRGCCVELIMKDNNTIGGNPENVKTWCRIAREESDRL
jgi:hypothetical protein